MQFDSMNENMFALMELFTALQWQKKGDTLVSTPNDKLDRELMQDLHHKEGGEQSIPEMLSLRTLAGKTDIESLSAPGAVLVMNARLAQNLSNAIGNEDYKINMAKITRPPAAQLH